MKKIALVLSVMFMLLMSTAALAAEKTFIGQYWRLTGVWNTHSTEGKLVGKKMRFSRNLNPKDDIEIVSSYGNAEWYQVSQMKLHDWIWTGLTKEGKIEIIFNCEPSASVELGRDPIE